MVTIKDIAKRAEVSVATVSYVINNSRTVSPERTQRVLRAIQELDYVPNAVARGLRVRESRTLGFVISDITNPFYPDMAKACEDVAHAAGFSVIIMNTNEEDDRFLNAVKQVREGKVDGLIIASAHLRDRAVIEELVAGGYPIVLAHRRLSGVPVDTVVADNFSGAYAAVRHLISLGHRRIAMVRGLQESSVSIDRYEGYLKAMKDAQIQVHPEWVADGKSQYDNSYSASVKLINQLGDMRPTAIFTSNDSAALGVLDAVEDQGLKVPDDIAVVAFDDLAVAAIRSVQLTTVRIPRYEIGQYAARMLLDRIGQRNPPNPVEVVLPTSIVVRRTCGASAISTASRR